MAKGAYQLRDISDQTIRLYCPECHRFAQLGRAGLIERFGADQPMPSLLRILKPCSIGNGMSGQGGLPPAWQVDWHSRRD